MSHVMGTSYAPHLRPATPSILSCHPQILTVQNLRIDALQYLTMSHVMGKSISCHADGIARNSSYPKCNKFIDVAICVLANSVVVLVCRLLVPR